MKFGRNEKMRRIEERERERERGIRKSYRGQFVDVIDENASHVGTSESVEWRSGRPVVIFNFSIKAQVARLMVATCSSGSLDDGLCFSSFPLPSSFPPSFFFSFILLSSSRFRLFPRGQKWHMES